MGYITYSEHKDGEFFKTIPIGWEEERLQDVAGLKTSNVDKKSYEGQEQVQLCNYVDVYYNAKINSRLSFMKATANENEIRRFKLNVGDVVITKDSEDPFDIGIPALISEDIEDLVCGYHLSIMESKSDRLLGGFLFYALEAGSSKYQFTLASNGVTRFGLTQYGTKNLKICLPDLNDQQTIATFLDYKTHQIDQLIEKKKALIEKLEEKRIAVITQAVTKGLDKNAKMKPSGVEWLGDVPAGWEVLKIQRILQSIEQGTSPVASNQPPEILETGVIKVSAIKSGFFYEKEAKTLEEKDYNSNFKIHAGDLLVTRGNTPNLVADASVVEVEPESPLMMSDLIYRLNTMPLIKNKFLCCWLLSYCGRLQIKNDARGSSMTMAKVSQGHIKSWLTTLPPLEEQIKIIEHIENVEIKIQNLLHKSQLIIESLQEYRSALITSAVTGKIDVRNVEPPKEVA